ncbi:hypothetical protein ACIB24_03825 [Spongisporangium articulatum]|uniref:Uncharacterized protein n=1 Tax=Spongisporangium articulatum TaxID=3362603 RepID=A0ABW8AIJ5_9ACTN
MRVVGVCVGRAGDEGVRWSADDVERVLRPSAPEVPPAQRCSVGDFWWDASDGRHDLTPSVALPAQELPADHPAWVGLEACSADFTPGEQLSAALQGLIDGLLGGGTLGPEMRSAEAILVLTTTGSPLAWTQLVEVAPDVLVPCAHVPIDVAHTTLAHEVGHLLGYGHSFGLSTARVGAEYGDPYCIMSARRFGGRTVQVTRSLTGGDLRPGAALWSMAGPDLARASAWAQQHDWPAPSSPAVQCLAWPSVARPVTVAHSGLRDRAPRLVAFGVPGRTHWLTLEVRGPLPDGVEGPDWDAAFRLDREPSTGRPLPDRDPHDAPGLVVHEIDETACVTYRGTVALPLGGDTDVEVGPEHARLTIRATGYSGGVATVLVGPEPGVPMAWARVEEGDGGPAVHAFTAGYAEPVFTWWLDGVELAAAARLGDAVWDRLPVPDHGRDVRVEIEVREGAGTPAGPREPRFFDTANLSGDRRVEIRCTAL